MTSETPYLLRLGELQEDAAKLFFHSLPEKGWASCSLEYREAGPVSEVWAVVTDSDGNTEPIEPSFAPEFGHLCGILSSKSL